MSVGEFHKLRPLPPAPPLLLVGEGGSLLPLPYPPFQRGAGGMEGGWGVRFYPEFESRRATTKSSNYNY